MIFFFTVCWLLECSYKQGDETVGSRSWLLCICGKWILLIENLLLIANFIKGYLNVTQHPGPNVSCCFEILKTSPGVPSSIIIFVSSATHTNKQKKPF